MCQELPYDSIGSCTPTSHLLCIITVALAGFSDPYCMLGVIPGSRLAELSVTADGEEPKDEKTLLRRLSSSLKRGMRNKKDKTKHIIPAKFIQSTKVIENSLNPTWNERFKL